MNRLSAIILPFAALLSLALFAPPASAQGSPQAAVDELLAAERALSAAAAGQPPADGMASMLADDAIALTPQGPLQGRAAIAANWRANPGNAGTHASWRSIRGGVSADGQHGFTLGYLDIAGGDPARAHRRYLAYWVRGADGWRVARFRQALAQPNDITVTPQPPSLPAALVAPTPARQAEHNRSLIAAEQAFSDRAQQVGIRQSFQENGRRDAIHLFGLQGFAVGLAAIDANHAAQGGSTTSSEVSWNADSALVATSGDLGITLGAIRRNAPAAEGQPAGPFPFFTIWRRDSPDQPWRYIAE